MFLRNLKEAILNDDENGLICILEESKKECVSEKEWIKFVESFTEDKNIYFKDAININGMGGTRICKPNISSIAAIYIALMSDYKVIKTGSKAYSGCWGSSDFFSEYGLLECKNKVDIINKYNFAYFDYLELSPWKKYKNLLMTNDSIKTMLDNFVCLDYKANKHFFGLSSINYFDTIRNKRIINKPNELNTFFTITTVGIIDEIVCGDVFINNIPQCIGYSSDYQILSNINDIKCINLGLLTGKCEYEYWKNSLAVFVSSVLCVLDKKMDFDETCVEVLKVIKEGYAFDFLNSILKSY